MKIIVDKVKIHGFQSIGDAEVKLSNRGIVCVKGINNYEDFSRSNGSGKSSIFESIFFAIYGRTSEGIAYPENRYMKDGCSVELTIFVDGVKYVITRTSKGKTSSVRIFKEGEDISGRNKKDTENIICNDVIKISQDIFLSTVFLSQGFSGKLSSLQPSGRKERIETLTDTNVIIEKFRDNIQDIKNGYNEKYNKLSSDLSFKRGTYSRIQEENSQIEKEISEAEKSKPDGDIDNISKSIEDLESQNEILQSKYDNTLNLYNEISMKIVEKGSEYNNIMNESNRLRKNLQDIKGSDSCPTCGRKYDGIDKEHINKSIQELNNKLDENSKRISSLGNEYKGLEEKKNSLNEKMLSIKSIISSNNSEISRLRLLKEEILRVVDTEPLKNKLNENKVKMLDLSKESNEMEKDIQKYKDLYDTANHCTTLITRQFRNYLLKNTIEFMNSRLNKYSYMLFSNNADVIKLVQDGSNLDIFLGEAPYSSLSGGEKRKVDIALILAQKDLALNISGLNCNLLILDEIFESLDDEAIMTVTEVLMSVSSDIDSMFVISHKDTDIGYDSVITVTKNKDRVSSIIDN